MPAGLISYGEMVKRFEYPNLDFLRACAVLLVLFDHTFQTVVGRNAAMDWVGRLGVLFFFVHTSCVLMMSLQRQQEAEEPLARNFYIRRLFRIYPLSIVAVIAAFIGPGAPQLSVGGWLANLALIQNLTYSPNAFGVLWSLPPEVQMYVMLPFLFVAAQRVRSIIPLLVAWVATLLLALAQPHVSERLTVFAFMPCFFPGVIAWWLISHRRPRFPSWSWPFMVAALVAGFLYRPSWHYPAWLTCLALGLAIPFFEQIENRYINRVTHTIAKYSYGIYLSHFLLLLWMKPTWRTLPLFFAALAAVSWLGFHCIEQPMINLGKRITGRRSPTQIEVSAAP